MRRASRVFASNPYAVLGVDSRATIRELKAAYRQNAIAWNPDRMPDEKKAEAAVRFQEIKTAFYDLKKKGIDLAAAAPIDPPPRSEEVTRKFSEEVKRATQFQRRLFSSTRAFDKRDLDPEVPAEHAEVDKHAEAEDKQTDAQAPVDGLVDEQGRRRLSLFQRRLIY
jgi:curved DNA-binding protein CbpA